MVEDAIAIFRVGHDDALMASVALILFDSLFKEAAREGRCAKLARFSAMRALTIFLTSALAPLDVLYSAISSRKP
ncbi:hypothetical protein B1812_12855 [Methylocystis bryophila]|uniref:Uncharacterized protein n=1 Tax=Methylocystis bryophila TaxID=655015 RepID=A0A1W6MW48_9HYPH|nr:hypothetical protein B1812_12855 [Methylocystis bryophila]